MRKFISIFIVAILATISCFGQSEIDSLVQIGIQYHDNGEYKKAIEVYNEALKIDPKSTLANYELALTYMYSGNNENAIKHSDVVINQNEDHILDAYITKGSSLSNLGKVEEALAIFNEALEKFGENGMLCYNMGISYSKINDSKNAELAFINAIKNKPSHASSHISLAVIEYQQNKRVESLLSLYYFLFLEPSSKRAETAYKLLKEQLGGNAKKDKNDKNSITIFVDPKALESEFSLAEFVLATQEALNMSKENKKKTPEELFIETTKSFFTVLGELKENGQKASIWWDFYVPFFYDLAKSKHIDTFCYFISMHSNDKALEWLKNNTKKVEEFEKWLKK